METKKEDVLLKKREIIKNKAKLKKEIKEIKENVKIDILDQDLKEPKTKIVKKDSGVYHDGKRLLFEADEEYEVKSCCGSNCNIDKGFLEFIAKFIISGSVLGFSMMQLASGNGDKSYFASTISLILGIYINNTDGKSKDKKKD